jgi:hypothetical protein
MKILVILVLLVILASLSQALWHLLRERGRGDKTLRALTWRIGLSIALFVGLMASYWLGWIAPHDPVSQPVYEQEQH